MTGTSWIKTHKSSGTFWPKIKTLASFGLRKSRIRDFSPRQQQQKQNKKTQKLTQSFKNEQSAKERE